MAAQLPVTVTRASSHVIDPAADGCATKRGTLLALIVLARPWQWVKNGLVLAALVFSHRLFHPRDAFLAAVALVAFCSLSSFAYVLNDISDREADRLNPEKRALPLARGDHTIAQAACFAIALRAIAALLSAALGRNFLAITALYVALQFGYSLWAKQYVVLDVVAVAIGFVLRAFAGGIAIGVEVSPWLVFITFVLAMLLVIARRRHELVAMGDGATAHRRLLVQYGIRLCHQMLAIIAGATPISYMIYTASAEVEAKLGTRYLYLTVPFVAFGILRYLYLVDARNEGGDPARLLIRDMPLLLTVLLWIAADMNLLYFQAASAILRHTRCRLRDSTITCPNVCMVFFPSGVPQHELETFAPAHEPFSRLLLNLTDRTRSGFSGLFGPFSAVLRPASCCGKAAKVIDFSE